MSKDFTNSFILNSLKLPVFTDISSFSNSIALSGSLIYSLTSKTDKFYTKFLIKKRNGTDREILSPSYSLKHIQRWILKEILEKVTVSPQAMAYKKGKGSSTKKNAAYHKFSAFILEMDLKDFFPSIKREKIFYLFRNLGYNKFISNVLADLCTYDGYLPQGGVCSPFISNIICFSLDKRLTNLCGNRDILYTRYADDLTFSCDNKQALKKIRNVIEDIIVNEGFVLNIDKTRFLSPISHKTITGVTINDGKLKANKVLKRNVRAMIHKAIITGDYNDIDKIRGIISYINSIEDGYKEKMKQYISNFGEKDCTYFKDVVDAHNEHMIYKDIKRINQKNIEEFGDKDFIPDFLRYIEEERHDYLVKKGYLSVDVVEEAAVVIDLDEKSNEEEYLF